MMTPEDLARAKALAAKTGHDGANAATALLLLPQLLAEVARLAQFEPIPDELGRSCSWCHETLRGPNVSHASGVDHESCYLLRLAGQYRDCRSKVERLTQELARERAIRAGLRKWLAEREPSHRYWAAIAKLDRLESGEERR